MSEHKLKNFDHLIDLLNESINASTICKTIEHCKDIIRSYYDDLKNLSKQIQKELEINPIAYTVYKTSYGYKKILVHRSENYEIYLIIWEPYSQTPIHDHSDNGCLMMCLNNNLNQTIFGLRNKDQTSILTPSIQSLPTQSLPTQSLPLTPSTQSLQIIPKEIKQDLIEAGDVSYIDNSLGYHMIKNLNLTHTESIHIYSPPSYKANIYN